MLDIVSVTEVPSAEDYCFVFSGRDAVGDLRSRPGEPWLRGVLQAEFGIGEAGVCIGRWCGKPAYAMNIEHDRLDPSLHIINNLFAFLGRVSDEVFAAQGRAIQILNWRRDHRFCGRCGGSMQLADAGRGLHCGPCDWVNYPRLSPCAIFLISRGEEMLLAAANGRRTQFYSTLAGFIEPGEDAEAAVAREAQEEVGVEVSNIRYFKSQAWPFPGQLMLGFYADYAGGEIAIDSDELEHADWFTVDNLPPVPPMASISGQLIAHFIETHR